MVAIAYFKGDSVIKTCDKNTAGQMTSNAPISTASNTTNTVTMPSAYVTEPVPNPPDVIMQCHKVPVPTKSAIEDFIECFSLSNNMSILMGVQKSASAVPIIDGLKYVA